MTWPDHTTRSGIGTEADARTYIECPMCGNTTLEGTACDRCFAPGELIDAVVQRPRPPRFVGVLGPSGVGKTVYLGILLDMLARGLGGLRGHASGATSLAMHQNVILSLERQRFPEKTPNEPDRWQWVHCEIHLQPDAPGSRSKRKGRGFDLIVPDVAGEAVAAELNTPRTVPTIRTLIRRCDGLIVLIDVEQVITEGQGQELFAMQLISYLNSLQAEHRNRPRKIATPVALVFTKADLCVEALYDPVGFATANVSELVGSCEARLEHWQFFASGVAGAVAALTTSDGRFTPVPLRVEPYGILEPFLWMAHHLA